MLTPACCWGRTQPRPAQELCNCRTQVSRRRKFQAPRLTFANSSNFHSSLILNSLLVNDGHRFEVLHLRVPAVGHARRPPETSIYTPTPPWIQSWVTGATLRSTTYRVTPAADNS